MMLKENVTTDLDISRPDDGALHLASPADPHEHLKYAVQTVIAGALGTYDTLGLVEAEGVCYKLASTLEVYGSPW